MRGSSGIPGIQCSCQQSSLSCTGQGQLTPSSGILPQGVVVGSILLAADHLPRVEQLPVGAGSDLIYHSGLQVNEDSPGVICLTGQLVTRYGAVRLKTMLEAVKQAFPLWQPAWPTWTVIHSLIVES